MKSGQALQNLLYRFYRALAEVSLAQVSTVASKHAVARGLTSSHLVSLHASARRGSFEDFYLLYSALQEHVHASLGLKRSSQVRRYLSRRLILRQIEARKRSGGGSGGGTSRFLRSAMFSNKKAKLIGGNPLRKPGRKMSVSKGIAVEYEDPPLGAKLDRRPRRSKKAKKHRDSFIILTPQMGIKRSADERSTFLVSVFLDNKESDSNATVEKTKIRDTSRTGIYRLGVELSVSRQFRVIGVARGLIEVNRATTTSKAVEFKIRRTGEVMPPGGGQIDARIYNGDHPCGRISKRLGGRSASVAAGKPKPFASEQLPHQDAIVEVQRYDGQSGFHLRVKYPGLKDDWVPLLGAGRELDREIAETFGAVGNEPGGNPTINFLRGVGIALFSLMPANFKALVDILLGKKDSTLIVYSDEGMIPWELLVRRVGVKTDSLPIGAHIIMARWITDTAIGLRMPPKLDRAFVSVATPKSAHADREADQVKEYLPRSVVKNFQDCHVMCRAWAKAAEPIIHYIGHGDVKKPNGHAIAIEGTRLTSLDIMGNKDLENRFALTRPLVFLNACMAGQAPVKYLDAHGLPLAFIGKGASAVVSPNWEVGDGTAIALSRRFYAAFRRKNKVSMARVLRDARRLSYNRAGNQTWAAYSFFGHPAAHGN